MNEDEENLDGLYSNEMHMLELANPTWRLIELKGKKDSSKSKDKETDDADMESDAQASTQGLFFPSIFSKFNSISEICKFDLILTSFFFQL